MHSLAKPHCPRWIAIAANTAMLHTTHLVRIMNALVGTLERHQASTASPELRGRLLAATFRLAAALVLHLTLAAALEPLATAPLCRPQRKNALACAQ